MRTARLLAADDYATSHNPRHQVRIVESRGPVAYSRASHRSRRFAGYALRHISGFESGFARTHLARNKLLTRSDRIDPEGKLQPGPSQRNVELRPVPVEDVIIELELDLIAGEPIVEIIT